LTKTVATATSTSTTNTVASTDTGKTLGITGGNTANQSWGVDTIGDADVLRRLYDLYRFAVTGNDQPCAQMALLNDYPLQYNVTSIATPAPLAIDPNSTIGSNCVLCGLNSASASPSPPSPKVCEASNARTANQAALASSCGYKSYRVELRDLRKQRASVKPAPSAAATAATASSGQVCLTLNQRLLPRPGQGRWLLWEALPGANRRNSEPPPNPDRDVFLGVYGHYALYVDGRQPDRFAEFVIFITAAAISTPNPSSNGASTGQGAPKAPAQQAIISSNR
jgi:hypothetical protein